ncbi:hypothetical protein BD560DRAFT_167356 [Blakeslea trispora]|nr:hypothetical protein BD560DRAFT_167356 [Blakeslea trispora]
MLFFDNDFVGRGIGFCENGGQAANKYGECPGVCWTIATSEHHGQASMGTAIGWVRSYNIYQVKMRKLHVYFHSVYKLHYTDETGAFRYLDGFVPETVDESKKLPSYQQFGDTHMSIQKVC